MTPVPGKRKPHSKSRRGCYQCKQRHTKCNELHPRCGNCTRLDIDCTWPGLDSRASSQSASSARQAPISPAHSTDHDSNSTTSTTALPLDDMRLMHHFMWRVALIYRYDAEFEKIRIWSVEVVDIAFEYPFLLHGILAIAAMHKTLEDPSADRSSLLEQADAHMSRSLAVYRQYLGHPTLETSLPTFLLSSLLVCYNLSSAGVEEPEQPIDAALHCFRLLRGIKVAIGDFWARLIEHPIVIHLLSGVVRADAVEIAEGKVYNEILVLKELAMQLDSAHREVYLRTVDSLHRTYLVADTCEDPIHVHNYFMTWPAIYDDEYLNLIGIHDPFAIIVVAHYALLMARAPNVWWLRGWPVRIINASVQLLEPHPEFRKWLDWPVEQLPLILESVARCNS